MFPVIDFNSLSYFSNTITYLYTSSALIAPLRDYSMHKENVSKILYLVSEVYSILSLLSTTNYIIYPSSIKYILMRSQWFIVKVY